jgi:hypothetical protein
MQDLLNTNQRIRLEALNQAIVSLLNSTLSAEPEDVLFLADVYEAYISCGDVPEPVSSRALKFLETGSTPPRPIVDAPHQGPQRVFEGDA